MYLGCFLKTRGLGGRGDRAGPREASPTLFSCPVQLSSVTEMSHLCMSWTACAPGGRSPVSHVWLRSVWASHGLYSVRGQSVRGASGCGPGGEAEGTTTTWAQRTGVGSLVQCLWPHEPEWGSPSFTRPHFLLLAGSAVKDGRSGMAVSPCGKARRPAAPRASLGSCAEAVSARHAQCAGEADQGFRERWGAPCGNMVSPASHGPARLCPVILITACIVSVDVQPRGGKRSSQSVHCERACLTC